MMVRDAREFEGVVLRTDGTLSERVVITGIPGRRGDGDGLIWRGSFEMASALLSAGETLHIRLDDNSMIAAVVTEIGGRTVCFRARGKMP
jgi:hypothetical protein